MKRMTPARLICVSVFALALAAASSVQADLLGQWTFETGSPSALPTGWTSTTGSTGATYSGIPSDIGTGSAGVWHASTASVLTAPAGNGSPRAFSANRWAQTTDYYQFTVNLPVVNPYYGWGKIGVSYDQNGSASGPRIWNLAYSTDGSTFTTFGADYLLTPGISWNTTTPNQPTHLNFDLSSVVGLNTASTLYFRIVDNSPAATGNMSGGAVSTGGTSRIDNFIVTIPEPATGALLGLGLLAFWSRLRRAR